MNNLTLNHNNAPKICGDINNTNFVSKIAKYAKITAVALGVIAIVGAAVATAVPTFGASIGIAGAVAAGFLGLGGITARIKNLFSSTVAKPADMPREKVFQPSKMQISLESNLIERQTISKAGSNLTYNFNHNLETIAEEDENPALESIETITTPSEVKFEEDSKEEELKETPHSESKSSHVELDQNSISFSTARSNLIKNLFPKENGNLLKEPNNSFKLSDVEHKIDEISVKHGGITNNTVLAKDHNMKRQGTQGTFSI